MRKCAGLLLAFVALASGVFVQSSKGATFGNTNQGDALAFNRNSITGFVFNEASQPLADVHVELLDELYTTVSRSKTNGSGLYSFRGLPEGRFVVKVVPYGLEYEEQSRSVALISVSAVAGRGAAAEQADFYLKPRKMTNVGPLAAPGVVFAQEVPEDARKLYESGIEELANKRENEGFDKLKRSLEIFPKYFVALDRLGREYVFRGYYQASFVLFTQAIEVNPRSFSSTFGLGLSLYKLDQVQKSIELFQRATELDNKQVNGFLWLGISLLQNKDLSQAEAALTKAKKLSDGKSADVSWQLARVYKDQKLYGKSADELEVYLTLNPNAANKEDVLKTIKILRQKESSK